MSSQSKFIFIVLNFFSSFAFSQNESVIIGKILSEDSTPLDYVNIGIVGTAVGTVSDENGQFKLYLASTVQTSDIVRFSSIGYEGQDILVGDLTNDVSHEIILKTQFTELDEIVIVPDFENTRLKGNKNTSAQMNVSFSISKKPNQNLGAEIGRKFLIKKKSSLKKVRFFISHNNFDTVLFRINVYHISKRKPGKKINDQNIIHEVVGKKYGWVEVDLLPYDIISSKSIVVGVEWIGHSKKGSYLSLPITIPSIGSVHFYKFGSQNKWKRFDLMSSCMQLEYEY